MVARYCNVLEPLADFSDRAREPREGYMARVQEQPSMARRIWTRARHPGGTRARNVTTAVGGGLLCGPVAGALVRDARAAVAWQADAHPPVRDAPGSYVLQK